MALISPGVEVQVIDESFYAPAEPGTVPLIVVATAENKLNGAGTATASATITANAGKVFRVTSQRELVDLYGAPFFEKTASSSPVHGGERNEYGLLAAYSLLGVSNSAFILRANVDLNDLEGTTTEPGAAPADGKWWLDTQTSTWGIQEWNGASAATAGGQKFTSKTPIVLTDTDAAKLEGSPSAPKSSVGSVGDYAVVVNTGNDDVIRVFYKSAGNGLVAGGGTQVSAGEWVLVGSQEWMASHPTVKGSLALQTAIVGNIEINNSPVSVSGLSTATAVAAAINAALIPGVTAQAVNNRLYLYSNGETVQGGPDTSTSGNRIVVDNTGVGGNATTLLGIGDGDIYLGPDLQQTPHTSVPQWKTANATPRPTGSVWVKTTEPNGGARLRVRRYTAATNAWAAVTAPIYANGHSANYYLDRSGGGANLLANALFVQSNADEQDSDNDTTPDTAKFRIFRRVKSGTTLATSDIITNSTFGTLSNKFTVKQSMKGLANLVTSAEITFATTSDSINDANALAAAINGATFGYDGLGNPYQNLLTAEVTSTGAVTIAHIEGGEIRFVDGVGTPIGDAFTAYNYSTGLGTSNFYSTELGAAEDYIISNWKPLGAESYPASVDAPLDTPADGQLWYNPAFGEVDIMVHDGSTWVGYLNEFPTTDPAGPIVAASMPEEQSDGSSLVNGDLWISTADLENFPTIYRYDSGAGATLGEKWVLLDKTDQTTEDGVLFADARWSDSGAATEAGVITDLLISDYLDPDAPDGDLYPKGMLLWNLRRSGGNVKKYVVNSIDTTADNARFNDESMTSYNPDRWVTASPNQEDGSGSFGRKAQRAVVVAAIKSAIDTSEEARDEERRNFNIIACPGYPEALSNLINLNLDRKVTAFVVGDTPLRLKSDATSLTTWGSNANLALDNNDNGIVSYDEYAAVYYPNGFTTDLSGVAAVVPASHMMLRTIALSDQVSYPWFAPAGTRRGGITNATAVGYIDPAEGEFVSVALNNGQRDTLYDLKVNPIPFFNGVGLVAYGQKTRARNASALDRINVARLVVYLRSQLTKLARPYIFEPNDQITRDEIKQAVESILLELVGLRAIYDFAVVCDESNNTPARIDRNELYVDVAIEPTKAIEFIYIPLRLKNTGEI